MSIDSWGCGASLKMIFLTKGISAVMVIQYSTSAKRIEDFFSVLLICIGNVSLYKSHEVCVCLFWLFLSFSFFSHVEVCNLCFTWRLSKKNKVMLFNCLLWSQLIIVNSDAVSRCRGVRLKVRAAGK